MKCVVKINDVQSIDEILGYWNDEDFLNILEELEFSDARNAPPEELRELLEMALSDFKPHEAVEILLKYKLSNDLNRGQIQNLSHEMADDNEAEGNPDIALHYALFNINRLLYTAFNGVFPHAKATKVDFELNFKGGLGTAVTKEIALKAVCCGLAENSPIRRLFEDQLNGEEAFSDAEMIVWELHHLESNKYTIITSDYWMNEEDFIESEFTSSFKLDEDQQIK